jgi:hypothetical protein
VFWCMVILIIVQSVQIDLLFIRSVIWLPTSVKHVIYLVRMIQVVVNVVQVMMWQLVMMKMWNLLTLANLCEVVKRSSI